jgi:hypothetical protein
MWGQPPPAVKPQSGERMQPDRARNSGHVKMSCQLVPHADLWLALNVRLARHPLQNRQAEGFCFTATSEVSRILSQEPNRVPFFQSSFDILH